MRGKVSVLAQTAWAAIPGRGRFLFPRPARPGRARAVLAAPVDQRLFFAGEACSPHFFSTAHGAWQTGRRRARCWRQATSLCGGGPNRARP
jgi:monoamine oxidase